jgi:hypothetical protein
MKNDGAGSGKYLYAGAGVAAEKSGEGGRRQVRPLQRQGVVWGGRTSTTTTTSPPPLLRRAWPLERRGEGQVARLPACLGRDDDRVADGGSRMPPRRRHPGPRA